MNLLIYLDGLIRYGSATQVAEELNVTQPGVSAALRRLRALLDDPVMVRSGRHLVPTPKALSIHAQCFGALSMWRGITDGKPVTDMSQLARTYSILASDYVQYMILPGLVRELERLQSRAVVRVVPTSPYRRMQMVASREVDFAIGYYREAPDELRTRRLFEEQVVCVVRRGHPAAEALDLEAFSRCTHIGISSVGTGSYNDIIEQVLENHGVRRTLALMVPNYLVVPDLLLHTNHLVILPEGMARELARTLPLVVLPCPVPMPLLDTAIFYHNSTQNEPASRWFRDLVARTATARLPQPQPLQDPM